MADSTISGLTSGTVAASDIFAFVQSSTTKRDTIQGILDLVPASSNLGTSDLTSTANSRVFTLNGATSSNTFTIETSAGTDIVQFRADKAIYIPTGGASFGAAPLVGTAQLRMGGSNGEAYGQYIDGAYSVAGIRVLGATIPNKYSCSNIGSNQVGYNSEGNSAATVNRSAHRAYIIGSNTAANIGFTCEVANGAYNYALDVVSGDFRFGTVTGTKIGTATTEKLSFWNTTPIVQPTALTAADATATDGTIGTADTLINNMRIRINELEAKLSSAFGGVGLIA